MTRGGIITASGIFFDPVNTDGIISARTKHILLLKDHDDFQKLSRHVRRNSHAKYNARILGGTGGLKRFRHVLNSVHEVMVSGGNPPSKSRRNFRPAAEWI